MTKINWEPLCGNEEDHLPHIIYTGECLGYNQRRADQYAILRRLKHIWLQNPHLSLEEIVSGINSSSDEGFISAIEQKHDHCLEAGRTYCDRDIHNS